MPGQGRAGRVEGAVEQVPEVEVGAQVEELAVRLVEVQEEAQGAVQVVVRVVVQVEVVYIQGLLVQVLLKQDQESEDREGPE